MFAIRTHAYCTHPPSLLLQAHTTAFPSCFRPQSLYCWPPNTHFNATVAPLLSSYREKRWKCAKLLQQSQPKAEKKQTHDLLLCLIVKREVTCDWGLWVGVCSHLHWCMCACICVCVCVMGVWVGVNVTANLLTFPKACISPPRETDPDRRCYDNETLVSLSPWGAYGGVEGGPRSNMLTPCCLEHGASDGQLDRDKWN